MVVKQQILVDLLELRVVAQPGRQDLDVLQRHPVLEQLLVHAVHVSDDAIGLNR